MYNNEYLLNDLTIETNMLSNELNNYEWHSNREKQIRLNPIHGFRGTNGRQIH